MVTTIHSYKKGKTMRNSRKEEGVYREGGWKGVKEIRDDLGKRKQNAQCTCTKL